MLRDQYVDDDEDRDCLLLKLSTFKSLLFISVIHMRKFRYRLNLFIQSDRPFQLSKIIILQIYDVLKLFSSKNYSFF